MLLQHEPEATTELLIDLCSGQLGKKPALAPLTEGQDGRTSAGAGPAMLSYLGVNRVAGLFTGEASSPTTATGSAIPPPANGASATSQLEKVDEAAISESPTYEPPSPRRYFAHFVDHQSYFIHFLEAVAGTLWDQRISTTVVPASGPLSPRPMDIKADGHEGETDQRAVWNTLLELYLTSTKSGDAAVAKASKQKALALLADLDKPYDPIHAMILCSTAGFTDGLVGLWESMGMYEDVLRYWMDLDKTSSISNGVTSNGHSEDDVARVPSDEVLRCLDLYGPTNLHLYPLVLRYLTSSPAILSRHSSHLPRLLQTIDENRILPPLAVIQLLSRNGVASVGNVKEWLKTKVEETRQDVESDKHLVESYRNETKEKERELKALANPEQPEVFQVTRCAACNTQLDLPSVHFMCKHSYHQRCVLLVFE